MSEYDVHGLDGLVGNGPHPALHGLLQQTQAHLTHPLDRHVELSVRTRVPRQRHINVDLNQGNIGETEKYYSNNFIPQPARK